MLRVPRGRALTALALAIISFVALPTFALAGTIVLSPASGSFTAGGTFQVSVIANSPVQAINAVSATLHFPTDTLQVVALSQSNSIVSLWVQQPSFSNADGTVSLEGVIPNPGFTGSGGRVLSITFRARSAGAAHVSMSDGSMLANDGQGTETLDSLGSADYSVAAAASTPAPTGTSASNDTVPTQAGTAPTITSTTHPDQTKWYNKTVAELDWTLDDNATAVRLGYGSNANGLPTVSYDTPMTHKELQLDQGISYFHVQEKMPDGWGPVATFKLQVDTTPPKAIHITFPHGATTNDPRPLALFNTSDALSGIDHYEVLVNGNGLVKLSRDEITSNPYDVPIQAPGPGTLQVTAYDKAGNSTSDQADFTVIGLDAPTLDPVEDISSNQILQVSGLTYPSARVDVFIKDASGETTSQWTRTSTNGAFRVIWSKSLPPGVYTLHAQTTDDKGAKSVLSTDVSFTVHPVSLFALGWGAANYLTLGFLTLLVVAAICYGLMHAYRRIEPLHRSVRMSIKQARLLLHRQFRELSRAVEDELKSLDRVKTKRSLTKEEARLIRRLRGLLDRYEEEMDHELDSVEE